MILVAIIPSLSDILYDIQLQIDCRTVNLVSLRQCHFIWWWKILFVGWTVMTQGNLKNRYLCTLKLTTQRLPKDSAEVREWHYKSDCDGSRICNCKSSTELPENNCLTSLDSSNTERRSQDKILVVMYLGISSNVAGTKRL